MQYKVRGCKFRLNLLIKFANSKQPLISPVVYYPICAYSLRNLLLKQLNQL